MARFFSAVAVWGKLCFRDIPDRGPWNPDQIAYWDELYLDAVSHLALTGRKVGTAADLDAAVAASRVRPGIRTLWIREDLLADAQRLWEENPARAERRPRTRMYAVLAATVAAAFAIGLMGMGRLPAGTTPPLRPNRSATRVLAVPPGSVGTAYAVSVGSFVSPVAANRMMHLVRSSGYIVNVVPRGAVCQVVTSPFRTRTQAESVARGLEQIGFPAHLTTWRAL